MNQDSLLFHPFLLIRRIFDKTIPHVDLVWGETRIGSAINTYKEYKKYIFIIWYEKEKEKLLFASSIYATSQDLCYSIMYYNIPQESKDLDSEKPNQQKSKAPQQDAEGLGFAGSPYWKRLELFVAGKLSKNCETSIN